MVIEIAFDGGLQIDDRAEDTAFETTPRERREEGFDGVKPGARCRGEVENPARMAGEPLTDLFVLMGGVVVENDVDHLAGRHVALDGVEAERGATLAFRDERLMPVALHALAEHGAIKNVERNKQCSRAVTDIVMGHCPAFIRLERQTRLGAIQGLNLMGLLVDRLYQTVRRRIDIKADDVMALFGERGSLERLNVLIRCGCGSCSAQIRCAVPCETPAALAKACPIQCVTLPGGS